MQFLAITAFHKENNKYSRNVRIAGSKIRVDEVEILNLRSCKRVNFPNFCPIKFYIPELYLAGEGLATSSQYSGDSK